MVTTTELISKFSDPNIRIYVENVLKDVDAQKVVQTIKNVYYRIREMDYVYPDILSIIAILNGKYLNFKENELAIGTILALPFKDPLRSFNFEIRDSLLYFIGLVDGYLKNLIKGYGSKFGYFDLRDLINAGFNVPPSLSKYEVYGWLRGFIDRISERGFAGHFGPYLINEIDYDPRVDIMGYQDLLAQYTIRNDVIPAFPVPNDAPTFKWLVQKFNITTIYVRDGLVRRFIAPEISVNFVSAVKWALGKISHQ